jgi:hypothetical protein
VGKDASIASTGYVITDSSVAVTDDTVTVGMLTNTTFAIFHVVHYSVGINTKFKLASFSPIKFFAFSNAIVISVIQWLPWQIK